MQVTGTCNAYISKNSYITPRMLKDPKHISELTFWGQSMEKYALENGYTKVGVATITVELVEDKALVANKIEALREEAKALRADATAKCTRIEAQIQNLLAIEDGTATDGVFAAPAGESEIPF